jgi:hypothetical protein
MLGWRAGASCPPETVELDDLTIAELQFVTVLRNGTTFGALDCCRKWREFKPALSQLLAIQKAF